MRRFLFFTTAMILSAVIKAQGVEHNGAVIAFSSTTFCYDTITRGSDGECAFEFTNVGDEPPRDNIGVLLLRLHRPVLAPRAYPS